MLQLTEQQSMELFWNKTKVVQNRKRYKYTSKSQWKCLNCSRTIFVNYLTDNPSSIYCNNSDECRGLKHRCKMHANQVEINYFRLLKEEHFNILINIDDE